MNVQSACALNILCRFISYSMLARSRDSSVGMATGYGWTTDVRVRVPVGSRIFSSPHRPDRIWGPPSLISNEYRGQFLRGQSGKGVKLTT
jgi:hypothetical protein